MTSTRTPRRARSHALAAGACAVLLTATSAAAATNDATDSANSAGSSVPAGIADRISDDNLWADMEAMYDIAMANGGNRAAGTPGYAATIDHVEEQLQAAGYDTWREPVTFLYSGAVVDELEQLTPDEREIEHTVFTNSPGTDGPAEAELAAPDESLGCTADDYGGADLTGQIALVERGECTFAEKSIAAGQVGALAVVIYNNGPGMADGTMGPVDPDHIATVGITRDLGLEWLDVMESEPVELFINLEVITEERDDDNLFAETPAGDPDNLIVLGAHADGVPAGPGIHDNASGTAATLEVARELVDQPVKNKVRFAFWSVEELGLIGSIDYVNNLTPAELAQHKAYINLDMVAPLDHQNTLGVLNPPQAGQMPLILTDYLESVDHPWGPANYAGNSDYHAFVEAGIPSSGLLSYYDDNYHTIDDDLDNVSLNSLGNSTRAVATLVQALAWDDSLALPAPDPSVTRAGGADRYDLAANIAEAAGAPDGIAQLASGEVYADALSVATLSAELDSPVLLTKSDHLPQRTAQALTTLGADEVQLIGGPDMIGPEVEEALTAIGVEHTRVGGANRYEVAANLMSLRDRDTHTLFVTSGERYEDALSAGALAGATGEPLLLVKSDWVPQVTRAWIEDAQPELIVVVGGPETIEESVLEDLATYAETERTFGLDRFETAVAVSDRFANHGVLYVTSGAAFADTLAASGRAGAHPAPILLTSSDSLPSATAAAIEERAPHTVVVVGGEETISDAVLDEVAGLIGSGSDTPASESEPEVSDSPWK